MNEDLKELSVYANMSTLLDMVEMTNPIQVKNPVIEQNKQITNYKIDKFRDQVAKDLKLKDMYMYFAFYPEPLKFLFIIEFDTPKVLNSKKLGSLLKYLDMYDYQKVRSEKELFLLFDIGENTNFDYEQFNKEKKEFEEVFKVWLFQTPTTKHTTQTVSLLVLFL